MPSLPVKRLHPSATLPASAHPGDAGLDLTSVADVKLEPGERAIVPTGIAVAIPAGYAGYVQPRSGLAAKQGIGIVNSPGLIDSGYRGEVKVILINLGSEPVSIEQGDRIAQLVILAVPPVTVIDVDTLPDTERGDAGFGSTGA